MRSEGVFYEKISGESDYKTHTDYQLITIMGRNLWYLEAYYIPECNRRSKDVLSIHLFLD